MFKGNRDLDSPLAASERELGSLRVGSLPSSSLVQASVLDH